MNPNDKSTPIDNITDEFDINFQAIAKNLLEKAALDFTKENKCSYFIHINHNKYIYLFFLYFTNKYNSMVNS